MPARVLYGMLGVLVIAGLLGSVRFLGADISGQQSSLDSQDIPTLDESEGWLENFKRVPAYYKAPAAAKPVVEKKPPPQPKPKRQPQLTDKRLIAIVEGQQQSIRLINANGRGQETQLLLGESWLKGWILTEIHSDFVVWSRDGTKQKQYLFKQQK